MQIKNTVTKSDKAIEERNLRDLEDKYGFKFPQDIKRFYLQYNGGILKKHYYISEEETVLDGFIFQKFYSIKYGLATLDMKMELNYADDWWPKEYIPFGFDGGGNSYCFHKESGKIYYIYEDDSSDDDSVPVEYIAPDFITFINNMIDEQ